MKRCLTIPCLFDLHTDLPHALYNDKKSAVSFDAGFEKQMLVAAFWVPPDTEHPYSYYRNMYRGFLGGNKLPVNCLEADKSVLFSLEGGAPFEKDLNRLYSFKKDKISSVCLTWNRDNSLAGGAFGTGGLTGRGVDAIRILNELSLALDLSHLNNQSLLSAAYGADFILASHSDCAAVHPHPRNLTDEALGIIAEKNGLVGINFYPEFVGSGDIFSGVAKHIEYMLSKGLENSVAIGSDLDGAEMDSRLSKTEDALALYEYLSDFFGEKLTDKLFYKNAEHFYEKLFDNRP